MENLSHTYTNSEWIKTLNKENIARDELGRLIIRLPELIKRPSDNKPLRTLSTKLLSPTDRIIQQPLTRWTKKLIEKYDEAINLNKYKLRAERLAEVYNNAALIFFSMGEVNKARDLCYAQIHLFIKRFSHFTFQPWINLSRIDRMTTNYQHALNKLTALDEIDYGRLANENVEIGRAVQTCALLEPIKIYLEMGEFQKVVEFIGARQDKFLPEHHSFMYEGLITALSNLHKTHDVLEVLHFVKTNASPVLMPICLLREAELFADTVLIAKLDQYVNNLLKKNNDINTILFGLHVAKLLTQINQHSKAIQLLKECMQSAKIINDEVLLIQALTQIYPLMEHHQERNHIEDMMVELYRETFYVAFRKKLLQCCALLSVIKVSSTPIVMAEFYQRLTSRADFF